MLKSLLSNSNASTLVYISKLNFVQHERDESDIGETFETDFHPNFEKAVNRREGVFNIKAEPHYECVDILEKIIKMEVGTTGAYVTAMSEANQNKFFPNAKLSPCDLILTSYNATELDRIGVMRKIKVNFRNEVKYLDLYIMKGEGHTLLGRQWLKVFGLWPIKEKISNTSTNKI